MKLLHIGNNEHVLCLNNGDEILFSYETPVAGKRIVDGVLQVFKTNHKWSNTTTKHINRYLKTFHSEPVELPQDEINAITA